MKDILRNSTTESIYKWKELAFLGKENLYYVMLAILFKLIPSVDNMRDVDIQQWI